MQKYVLPFHHVSSGGAFHVLQVNANICAKGRAWNLVAMIPLSNIIASLY